jgi:hypothetical protein
MLRRTLLTTLAAAVLLAPPALDASGPVGIYGIVERVVFEPGPDNPERVQVWGAFAYVDGGASSPLGVSRAVRGYLYFKLRSASPGFTSDAQVANTRREWADLKAVAGTGQAVGFGRWGYIAGFASLQPDARPDAPAVILEARPNGGEAADLRVRPATEAPANPATYQTNAGIVRLSASGSHAQIVARLRAALTE